MKKIVAVGYMALLALLLGGCMTTAGQLGGFIQDKFSSSVDVGPAAKPVDAKKGAGLSSTRLDVIIPVFDPALPEDPDDYEKRGIWPELRRFEANRFALNMKSALEDTEVFGAVRMAPDRTATGDLYVLGTIKESNGEDVAVLIEVVDISGKRWYKKTYKHRVKDAFHKNLRNKGKDPYQPLFVEVAEDIVELLRKKSTAQLEQLRNLTDIRFAASFSPASFDSYLEHKGGIITLNGLPDNNDRMFTRTRGIRVRDQLFIDRLQTHYQTFNSRISESYAIWQKESLTEIKAARQASRKALGETIIGGILIGLSVALAANTSHDSVVDGAVVGVAGGAALVYKGFQTRKEMKVHRDALAELGESIHLEIAPQIIEFEDETVELTGNAEEQFAQWREFLRRIYEQEKTPDVRI